MSSLIIDDDQEEEEERDSNSDKQIQSAPRKDGGRIESTRQVRNRELGECDRGKIKAEIPSGHHRYVSSGPTTEIWDPVRCDWTSGQGLLAKSNYKVSTKWDIVNNCVVAVKSIPVSSQHDVNKAKNEFELMKQLHHRNILQVLDCVEPTPANPEELLIVMKYISDGSLLSCMEKFYADASNVNKCLFTPDSVFRFFVGLLSALDCLDKNHIIHRDIKMANLLYDVQFEGVVLTDFDRSEQAAPEEDTLHTYTSNITRLPFRAPELLGDDPTVCYSHKSDMWALGCTMIEIATGKNPWTEKPAWADSGVKDLMMKKLLLKDGKTPPIPDLIKNTTPVFAHVLQQCFLHNSSDRWSAAQALEYIQKADGGKYLSYIPSSLERHVFPLVTATKEDHQQKNDFCSLHRDHPIATATRLQKKFSGVLLEAARSCSHQCPSVECIENLQKFYKEVKFLKLGIFPGRGGDDDAAVMNFNDKFRMTMLCPVDPNHLTRRSHQPVTFLNVKDLVVTGFHSFGDRRCLLVEGQAGMGKSTLCKYLAREQLRRDTHLTLHVDLPSLQRLLRLQTEKEAGATEFSVSQFRSACIECALFLFWNRNGNSDGKKEQEEKQQFASVPILWILDGFDEISHREDPIMQRFISTFVFLGKDDKNTAAENGGNPTLSSSLDLVLMTSRQSRGSKIQLSPEAPSSRNAQQGGQKSQQMSFSSPNDCESHFTRLEISKWTKHEARAYIRRYFLSHSVSIDQLGKAGGSGGVPWDLEDNVNKIQKIMVQPGMATWRGVPLIYEMVCHWVASDPWNFLEAEEEEGEDGLLCFPHQLLENGLHYSWKEAFGEEIQEHQKARTEAMKLAWSMLVESSQQDGKEIKKGPLLQILCKARWIEMPPSATSVDVDDDDDGRKPKFVHRAFAEYFVACQLFDNLCTGKANPLASISLGAEYVVILSLLAGMITAASIQKSKKEITSCFLDFIVLESNKWFCRLMPSYEYNFEQSFYLAIIYSKMVKGYQKLVGKELFQQKRIRATWDQMYYPLLAAKAEVGHFNTISVSESWILKAEEKKQESLSTPESQIFYASDIERLGVLDLIIEISALFQLTNEIFDRIQDLDSLRYRLFIGAAASTGTSALFDFIVKRSEVSDFTEERKRSLLNFAFVKAHETGNTQAMERLGKLGGKVELSAAVEADAGEMVDELLTALRVKITQKEERFSNVNEDLDELTDAIAQSIEQENVDMAERLVSCWCEVTAAATEEDGQQQLRITDSIFKGIEGRIMHLSQRLQPCCSAVPKSLPTLQAVEHLLLVLCSLGDGASLLFPTISLSHSVQLNTLFCAACVCPCIPFLQLLLRHQVTMMEFVLAEKKNTTKPPSTPMEKRKTCSGIVTLDWREESTWSRKKAAEALWAACRLGYAEVIVQLAQNMQPGISLIVNDVVYGGTCFWIACAYGHLEVIKHLSQIQGIDVRKEHLGGLTPFQVAVIARHLHVVRYFIEEMEVESKDKGSNINVPMSTHQVITSFDVGLAFVNDEYLHFIVQKGQTAVHMAAAVGYVDVLEYFWKLHRHTLRTSANDDCDETATAKAGDAAVWIHWNARDINGRTPFYLCCESGELEAVQFLASLVEDDDDGVSLVVDVHQAASNGLSPLQVAKKKRYTHSTDIVDLLLSLSGNATTTDAQRWRFCPKGHLLQRITSCPYDEDFDWLCDHCDRVLDCQQQGGQEPPQSSPPIFSCTICDFDLCEKCVCMRLRWRRRHHHCGGGKPSALWIQRVKKGSQSLVDRE